MTRRHRLIVLCTCSLSLFMNYIDSTALNVALPAIQRDFHASVAGLQWVVDGFLLVLASCLLVAGSTADRVGRKKMFHVGLATFSLASLLCSVAPNVWCLVAFRMVQALGGSLLVPTSLSIIRHTFDDPKERAQALGIWSGIFGIAAAAGPIIGGALVNYIGWRSVFWINVPVGVVGLVLSRRFIPESRSPYARRFDPWGQVLAVAVLGTSTYAVIEGPSNGWTSLLTLSLFGVSAIELIAFVHIERRRTDPLLEVHFFRQPPFAGAMVSAVLVYIAFAGFLFVNTLYLQEVRGDSALIAGAAFLPVMLVIAIFGPIAGHLVARVGTRGPLVVSGVAAVAGMLILTHVAPNTSFGILALAYALLGLGFGLVNMPITSTAVSSMPTSHAGVASALASASRQLGNVVGVAVMGSITTSAFAGTFATKLLSAGVGRARTAALVQHGVAALRDRNEPAVVRQAARAAFSTATHASWYLGAACGLCWAVVALFTVRARSSESPAERPSLEAIDVAVLEGGIA